MINCMLLVRLLLVSMVLLKCTNSPIVIHFLNFVPLFHLQVLLIIILSVSLSVILPCPVPNGYSCKDTFSFVSQIKNANLSKKFIVSYDVTKLFTNIPLHENIHVNLIFSHNPNLNITKNNLKNFSFLLHHRLNLFLTVSLTVKSMEQPRVLLQLLSLLTSSWVLTNLSGLINIMLTNLNFI